MAIKNVADLTTDNTNDIAAATNPDSIYPTLDAARRKDIIDSFWNKIDGITVGTVGNPLTIPPAFLSTVLPYGQQLQEIIQALLNEGQSLSNNINNTTNPSDMQGRPGLFLAMVDPTVTDQKLIVSSGNPNIKLATLLLTNDSIGGAFDNGNNWSTFNYKTPAAGFTGKFVTGVIEIEVVTISPPSSKTLQIYAKVFKGATLIGTSSVTGIDGSNVIGDKIYIPSLEIASASYAPNDEITVEIWAGTAGGTGSLGAVLKINSGTFSNQD